MVDTSDAYIVSVAQASTEPVYVLVMLSQYMSLMHMSCILVICTHVQSTSIRQRMHTAAGQPALSYAQIEPDIKWLHISGWMYARDHMTPFSRIRLRRLLLTAVDRD